MLILCLLLILELRTATSQILTSAQTATLKRFYANQERLYKKLFDNYNPDINGIYTSYEMNENDTSHPPKFEVTLSLSMLKLVNVVEPEEKVTFLFDYVASWNDIRLTWDPEEFGGINHLYVPRSKLWIPEVAIVDCSDIQSFENDLTKYAYITSNGSVGYYSSSVTSVICQLNVYKFPMDSHTCSVNLLFHTYLTEEFQIKAVMGILPRPVRELGNGEWQMQSIQLSQETVGENSSETVLQRFEASFSRNPGFYVALVMIPAYFINVLSIIALFINIGDRAEKFTIGLTNIMSMSFILVILSADLPKTRDLPLLAIYVITSLAIMLCSITAVVALPKLKSYIAKKRRTPIKAVEKPPEDLYGKIKFYFQIEYLLMLIFQLANFVNFILIFL